MSDERFLVRSPFNPDCEYFVGPIFVRLIHFEPFVNGVTACSQFLCKRFYQRYFHHPLQPGKLMKIVGWAIILDDASIFCLILCHNAVWRIVDQLVAMNGFSTTHVLCAFGLNDVRWYAQAECSINASLTTLIMFVVCLQCMDGVSEEVGSITSCMRNEGLFLAELSFECFFEK